MMECLSTFTFDQGSDAWEVVTAEATSQEGFHARGDGVHTRNGDRIELRFHVPERRGVLEFGFTGGSEHAICSIDLDAGSAALRTSDWRIDQPVASTQLDYKYFDPKRHTSHVLSLHKTEGRGTLVKNADIAIHLDGELILSCRALDLLPEMGVVVQTRGCPARVECFTHEGPAATVPEYLTVGAWQMTNRDDLTGNLESLRRGVRQAADQQVQLLLTPETSLTGLFPRNETTHDSSIVTEAEDQLRKDLATITGAPYLVVGLPAWRESATGRMVRYNVSRVYAPDGDIVADCAKIHSCEYDFWHGYRLNEFDIHGVPISMHICHDGRYPELWTLPVMFGARLVLHPSQPGGGVTGSVQAFTAKVQGVTGSSHAFYLRAMGGGSVIVSPKKYDNILAVSTECDQRIEINPAFPNVGEPREELISARIRIHDAFGYWPVRSFRASERAASCYRDLYQALGGSRTS